MIQYFLLFTSVTSNVKNIFLINDIHNQRQGNRLSGRLYQVICPTRIQVHTRYQMNKTHVVKLLHRSDDISTLVVINTSYIDK